MAMAVNRKAAEAALTSVTKKNKQMNTQTKSAVRPSICLSVVCNVRAPYSASWNFR